MRWDRLFDDLEGRFVDETAAQREATVAELIRAERAGIGLSERLVAHRGWLRLVLANGRLLDGVVVDSGAGWVVLDDGIRGPAVVPVTAMVEIEGLGWESAPPTRVQRRLTMGGPLRRLARNRTVVEVDDTLGRTRIGTIDAVGADSLEMALHARELPRRPAHVVGQPTIPFAAILCVTAVGPA